MGLSAKIFYLGKPTVVSKSSISRERGDRVLGGLSAAARPPPAIMDDIMSPDLQTKRNMNIARNEEFLASLGVSLLAPGMGSGGGGFGGGGGGGSRGGSRGGGASSSSSSSSSSSGAAAAAVEEQSRAA